MRAPQSISGNLDSFCREQPQILVLEIKLQICTEKQGVGPLVEGVTEPVFPADEFTLCCKGWRGMHHLREGSERNSV